jgi:hypothetical protein
MPMYPEFWNSPLQCTKNDDHRYWEHVLWKVHYIEALDEPTNQVPEIRVTCRYCDAPVEVADGWLPYPR